MPKIADVEQQADRAANDAPHEAAEKIAQMPTEEAISLLDSINPFITQQILREFSKETYDRLMEATTPELQADWKKGEEYSSEVIGSLMVPAVAIFRGNMTVGETIEDIRMLAKKDFITYAYVTDSDNHLEGMLVFRDLMLANHDQPIREVMHKKLFSLRPEMKLEEAMKATLHMHFPVYPICDEQNHLLGLIRGQSLFQARAVEISAQPGSMVGVGAGERLSTPLVRSLKMRHPWLQFNLLTAFVAAAVVGFFENTLNSLVILAAFLPVLAGQSGNTGCQALAVCLRGLTLGDLKKGSSQKLVTKEGTMGLINGALVGLVAATGMFFYARGQEEASPIMLALVVWIAMISSCVISGIAGAIIPLILKKFGADPATASSIFLTTATDVVSMGSFLGLATWLIL